MGGSQEGGCGKGSSGNKKKPAAKRSRGATRKIRKATGSSHSKERDPHRGSYDLGESIAILRAKVKVIHELIPIGYHLYSLLDHADKPNSILTKTIDPVRATPLMALDLGPFCIELDRVA